MEKIPRIHHIGTESKCEPEQFTGRGSSSLGENEETERMVLRTLTELLSMLEDSLQGTGHFLGLDRKRNGTELPRTNRMENGSESVIL